MKSIRVLIVDDEPLARDALRLLLEDRDDVDVVGECSNGNEAVASIRSEAPDLVLLDIQMPDLDGLDVVRTIGPEKMPVVIFATAYDRYALQAFEAQALDYILKPVDDDRFNNAINRAITRIRESRVGDLAGKLAALVGAETPQELVQASTNPASDRIMIRDKESVSFVRTGEIDWVEAAGDYVILHVGKQSHLLRESMTGMEDRLDRNTFARIHRSTIVNVDRIKELKSYFHGDYLVYLKDGQELRLSRRYWSRFEEVVDRKSTR